MQRKRDNACRVLVNKSNPHPQRVQVQEIERMSEWSEFKKLARTHRRSDKQAPPKSQTFSHRGVALADKATSPPGTRAEWDTMRLMTNKARDGMMGLLVVKVENGRCRESGMREYWFTQWWSTRRKLGKQVARIQPVPLLPPPSYAHPHDAPRDSHPF
ncbi:9045_t:CDS:2, partial [Acaulospora colombiana]